MSYKKKLLEILKNKFGHDDYKNVLQKEAVEAVYKGKNDVCIYMPSGFGKSLCYQLPILAKDKCFAIVISPSLAHAKNQVDYLKSIGVTAYTWNAYTSKIWIKNNVIPNVCSEKHKMKMLYVTAEVFTSSHFQFLLTNVNLNAIAYFVVDEAHCISPQSHDFKESYENLKEIKKRHPTVPIVAVTATANDMVKSDITEILHMNSKRIFSMPIRRTNLYYDVCCTDNIVNPIDHLKQFIVESLGSQDESVPKEKRNCGIIFCQNHNIAENLTNKLASLGLSVLNYSKRFKIKKRYEIQNLWTSGEINMVVTTSCFGKGISKQSVRFVVHWGIPLSIGHYYQETGRAGHDGLTSFCRIYHDSTEIHLTYNSIQNEPDLNCVSKKAFKKIIQQSFSQMKESFKTLECRQITIYNYFDEAVSACKNRCDVCKNQFNIERSIESINSHEKRLNCKRKNNNFVVLEEDEECCIVLSDDDKHDNIILSDCEIINVKDSTLSVKAKKKKKKEKKLHHKMKNKSALNNNSKRIKLSRSNDCESKTVNQNCDINVLFRSSSLSAEAQLEIIRQILYVKINSETHKKEEEYIELSDSNESDSIIVLE